MLHKCIAVIVYIFIVKQKKHKKQNLKKGAKNGNEKKSNKNKIY